MLTRSRRADIHSNATTAEVGPGAYETAMSMSHATKFGMAPFGSTSTRSTGGGGDPNPGPGAYFKEAVQGSAAKIRPSPQFASRQQRIPVDRREVESQNLPGPGAYSGNIVSPPARSAARPASGRGTMHAAEGINWIKVATAPSIPTVAQSYGYEEGPAGALVQQSAPYKGHAGVGVDRPGPGEYDPKDGITRPVRHAPNFGAQASVRHDPVTKDTALRPGPGHYDAAQCGNSDAFHGGVMAARQSSSFASNSKRTFILDSLGPGPGAYRQPSTFVPMREFLAAHPESFQAFGRSALDALPPKVGRDDAGSPGPGAYDAAERVTARNSAINKASSVFSSKAQRFGGQDPGALVPGPGAYTTTDSTLVNKLGKHINGRFGAFGSTSSRFEKPPAGTGGDDAVGPGQYDPPAVLSNPAEARRRDKRSAAFRSSSKRTDLAAGSASGTSFISPPSDWPKPSTTSRAFISNSVRFADGKADDVPGPGQYTLPAPRRAAKSDVPRAPRFESTKLDTNPGPGSYNTVPGMVRRTFNISIGV